MPNVFGESVQSLESIIRSLRTHGDAVRGTYRVCYTFDAHTPDPYCGAKLERPASLAQNPSDQTFPWEQVLVAAANCVGSDYPMLAPHFGVSLARLELVIEASFDPRGEFGGLLGYEAPPDARHCYQALHLDTHLIASGPTTQLSQLHRRAIEYNMVLGALRGIPRSDRLRVTAVQTNGRAPAF